MIVRCAHCRRFFNQRLASRVYCSDRCEREADAPADGRIRCSVPGCNGTFVLERRPGRRPTKCVAHRTGARSVKHVDRSGLACECGECEGCQRRVG